MKHDLRFGHEFIVLFASIYSRIEFIKKTGKFMF